MSTTTSEQIKEFTALHEEIAALTAEINYYKELSFKPMTIEESQAAIKEAGGLSNKNDTAFFALMDRVDHDDADKIAITLAAAILLLRAKKRDP